MKNCAVFLDRDGVINPSFGKRPPNNVDEFSLLPGVANAICRLNDAGYHVYVVTNQGGVGLGYMTLTQLDEIHNEMKRQIALGGGKIDQIMVCTHKPWAKCDCRKPKPGMILALAKQHQIYLADSYMIGDRDVDIQAGQAAGTQTILISEKPLPDISPDYTIANLSEAVDLILAN